MTIRHVNYFTHQLTDKDLPFYLMKIYSGNMAPPLKGNRTGNQPRSSEIPTPIWPDIYSQQLVDTGGASWQWMIRNGLFHLTLHLRRFQVELRSKIDGSINAWCADVNDTIRIVRDDMLGWDRHRKFSALPNYGWNQKNSAKPWLKMGCDLFQGYYHSPPIAESDCINYFKMQFDIAASNLNLITKADGKWCYWSTPLCEKGGLILMDKAVTVKWISPLFQSLFSTFWFFIPLLSFLACFKISLVSKAYLANYCQFFAQWKRIKKLFMLIKWTSPLPMMAQLKIDHIIVSEYGAYLSWKPKNLRRLDIWLLPIKKNVDSSKIFKHKNQNFKIPLHQNY